MQGPHPSKSRKEYVFPGARYDNGVFIDKSNSGEIVWASVWNGSAAHVLSQGCQIPINSIVHHVVDSEVFARGG